MMGTSGFAVGGTTARVAEDRGEEVNAAAAGAAGVAAEEVSPLAVAEGTVEIVGAEDAGVAELAARAAAAAAVAA